MDNDVEEGYKNGLIATRSRFMEGGVPGTVNVLMSARTRSTSHRTRDAPPDRNDKKKATRKSAILETGKVV